MLSKHSTQTPLPSIPLLSHAGPQMKGGGNNTSNLRQTRVPANPNPDTNPDVQTMIDAVMGLASKHDGVKGALREYLLSDQTLKEIARRHSRCPATLLYWIRKLGLPQRTRGRRKLSTPTELHSRVIGLVRQHSISEAARREGVSKQRASQIIGRWAPELKGKWIRKKAVPPPPKPKRPPPRKTVVSFRLSNDEWQLLQAARPELATGTLKLSAAKKARAILLAQLRPAQDEQTALTGSARSTTQAPVYDPGLARIPQDPHNS
jgi:transposase-like protein